MQKNEIKKQLELWTQGSTFFLLSKFLLNISGGLYKLNEWIGLRTCWIYLTVFNLFQIFSLSLASNTESQRSC